MKKLIFIFTIIGALLLFTACGSSEKDIIEDDSNEYMDEYQDYIEDEKDISETVNNLDEDKNKKETGTNNNKTVNAVDVDLTKLSATMVYGEVFNMLGYPESYIGKTIKMSGIYANYYDPNTGVYYHAVIIQDATACCAQGVEFDLEGEFSYPEDYPELGTEITVVGEFETYEEDGEIFSRVKNADML